MKDLEVTFDIEEGKDLDCVFKIDALSMNYDDLGNKPQINGITLEGNKTSADLKLASEQDIIDLQEKVTENEKRFDDYRTASEQDIIDDELKNIDNELKNTDTFLQNQITENKDNIDKVERELSYEADEREKADEALQEQITANASNFNNYRTASEQDVIDNGIKTDISNVQASVSDIQALIPNQASKENQLADKNFVNSSLSTDTANFLGTYDTLEELEAVPNPTNNDYGFVKSIDDAGNTVYSRYKYNATNAEWLFEYALNNSSFTAEQWTAINSGATNVLIEQITTNKNDIAKKQDIITDLTTIREGASKGATAVQPNQLHDGKLTIKANGEEVATFTANQATNVEADISIPDSATWGNITGTLSNQTDLQNALNTKQNKVSAGDNITINNNVISVSDTLSNQVATNTEKIKEIELFKFPNAVIIGEPVINNGQVSSFSTANYMQFPFIVDVKNKPFSIDFGFTTGTNVTTQQNIIDSNYGMSLAIQNGKALMAISSNGTSWDVGVISGTKTIQANSTYLARITWDGTVYKGYLSTDGGATYQEDMSLTSSLAPYPRTIYIGGGTAELLGHTVNPFLGIIDMNKAYLTVQGLVIWQGMDDAGLATRADVSLSNLNEQGLEVIRKNSAAPTNYVTTDTAQNITGAKNFINSATSTTPDAHTSMSITLKNDQAELGGDSTNSDGTVNFKYQGVRFVDKNNEEVASLYSAPDGIGGSFTRLNASAKVDGEYVDGFVELEVDANGKTHFYVPEVDEDSTVNGTQAATVDYVKDQVSTKQDTISDLSTIRSNAAKGATSVQLTGNQTIAGTKTFSSTIVGNLQGNVTGNVSGSSGSCTGNAATATKATQDGNGNNIVNTYATKTEATYTAGSAIDIDNNEVAVKLYDPSKFTIVGSPTITSDGVASGFSENNYAKSTFNLEENKTYTLIIEGIGGEPLTTRGSYLLAVYYKSISAASSTNLRLITTAKTGVVRFALGDIADVITPFIVTKNKPYKFKIITDFKSFVTVIDLLTGNAFTKDGYNIDNQEYGECKIEYGILGNAAPTNSSINLKSFSITVDGEEVFSGSKTIYQALAAKADLDLTNSTVPHIVETYVSGTSGYRIWSKDSTGYRYCEQWGRLTYRSTEADIVVSLLQKMKDTNYSCQITVYGGTSGYTSAISGHFFTAWSLTESSFTTHVYINQSVQTMWKVSGYISD